MRLPDPDISLDQIRVAFEETYWRRFRVRLPDAVPVLVKLHTAVLGHRGRVDLDSLFRATDRAKPAGTEAVRQVWFDDGWHATPVFSRQQLMPGREFVGPAIVEQLDCTVVIEPGDRVLVDALGNLLIEVGAPS